MIWWMNEMQWWSHSLVAVIITSRVTKQVGVIWKGKMQRGTKNELGCRSHWYEIHVLQQMYLTRPSDAQPKFGLLWQTFPWWWLPIGFCCLRCSAGTTAIGLSTYWCYATTTTTSFVCDNHLALFSQVWFSGGASWRHTWPNHDSL